MDKCNENASFLFYLNSMNKHAPLLIFLLRKINLFSIVCCSNSHIILLQYLGTFIASTEDFNVIFTL